MVNELLVTDIPKTLMDNKIMQMIRGSRKEMQFNRMSYFCIPLVRLVILRFIKYEYEKRKK